MHYNTITRLMTKRAKPRCWFLSLYQDDYNEPRYTLLFTYGDNEPDFIQDSKGYRKTYKTMEAAYADVCRVDLENAVMLVTLQFNFDARIENFGT